MMRPVKAALVLVFCLSAARHAQADSVTKYPTSASGTNWTSPTNIYADDASRTNHDNTAGDDFITTGTYAFGLDASAIIDSIYVNSQGYGTASQANRRRIDVRLTKDGTNSAGDTQTGLDQAQNSDTDNLVTGTTNPLWGTTWTVSEINATTFGVQIINNSGLAGSIYMDVVYITVYYHLPAAGGNRRGRILEARRR